MLPEAAILVNVNIFGISFMQGEGRACVELMRNVKEFDELYFT
jgi:hypothetical protein